MISNINFGQLIPGFIVGSFAIKTTFVGEQNPKYEVGQNYYEMKTRKGL